MATTEGAVNERKLMYKSDFVRTLRMFMLIGVVLGFVLGVVVGLKW